MAEIIAAAEGAITIVDDVVSTGTTIQGNIFNTIFSAVTSSTFLQIIGMIVIVGKCFFNIIDFGFQLFDWLFTKFFIWIFYPWDDTYFFDLKKDVSKIPAGFIPWLIRYIIVIATQVINLPKCFLWYFLDTLGWVCYLPFRLVFWLIDFLLDIGIISAEKEFWKFLDSIDYFIHGPTSISEFKAHYKKDKHNQEDPPYKDPDSMNLGFHVIHFSDAIMLQCYAVRPYRMADLAAFPMKSFQKVIACVMNPFS